MATNPTYLSADLILRLRQIRSEPKLEAARQWFLYLFKANDIEEFHQVCPKPYFDDAANFYLVMSYWDRVASLIAANLLNADLLFRTDLELLAVWVRIAHLVPQMREEEKNPGLYWELESAAAQAKKYLDGPGPEAYETFVSKYRQNG